MAEMTPDQIAAMFNELKKGFDSHSEGLDMSVEGLAKFASTTEKAIKRAKKEENSYNSLIRQIKDLDEGLDSLGDTVDDDLKRVKLTGIRKALAEAAIQAKSRETWTKIGKDALEGSRQIFGTVKSGSMDVMRGIQDGVSGPEIGKMVLKAMIDIVVVLAKGVGTMVQELGNMIFTASLGARNWLGVAIGLVLELGAKLFNTTVKQLGEVAKFYVDVVVKQIEMVTASYGTVTASGLLLANGLDGVKNNAVALGLTVNQFADVVKNSSQDLVASGLGVAGGLNMVAKTLKLGDGKLKHTLYNLGFNFQEQAELVATVMKDMRGSATGPLKASEEEIAQTTAEYAENLRIIAAVTGEDAKKKMEQIRDQASQLAFQQKLAQKPEVERNKIIAAMAGMNEMSRKNFMDMVNFGHVINKEGAAMSAMSSGARNLDQEYYASYQSGDMNLKNVEGINAQYLPQMQKDILGMQAIGLAGAAAVGGFVQALSEALGKTLKEIKGQTPEAIEAALKTAKEQAATNSELTNKMFEAQKLAQELNIKMQELMFRSMVKFAGATVIIEEILNSFEEHLLDIGVIDKDKPSASPPLPAAEVTRRQGIKDTAEERRKEQDRAYANLLYQIGFGPKPLPRPVGQAVPRDKTNSLNSRFNHPTTPLVPTPTENNGAATEMPVNSVTGKPSLGSVDSYAVLVSLDTGIAGINSKLDKQNRLLDQSNRQGA